VVTSLRLPLGTQVEGDGAGDVAEQAHSAAASDIDSKATGGKGRQVTREFDLATRN
jgi:hypothetical protein